MSENAQLKNNFMDRDPETAEVIILNFILYPKSMDIQRLR